MFDQCASEPGCVSGITWSSSWEVHASKALVFILGVT